MNEDQLKALDAELRDKDSLIAKLQANTEFLEKQLSELAAEREDLNQRLAESATAQKSLAELLKTSEPRLEGLKRANKLLKDQNAVLTRLHDLAAERARSLSKPLNA